MSASQEQLDEDARGAIFDVDTDAFAINSARIKRRQFRLSTTFAGQSAAARDVTLHENRLLVNGALYVRAIEEAESGGQVFGAAIMP